MTLLTRDIQEKPGKTRQQPDGSKLASAHTAFMEDLAGRDPLLASIFATVEEQSRNNGRWQYIWVGYQYDDKGNLRPEREAHAVFHAHQAADQVLYASGASPQQRTEFAEHISNVIAHPHARGLQEDIRNEIRKNSQDSFQFDQYGDYPIEEEQRRSKDLAQSLNNHLGHARAIIARGLKEHNTKDYVKGLIWLDQLSDLT